MNIRSYILNVSLAAIGCGIIQSIVPQKGSGKVLKMVCGFFLLLVACKISVDSREITLPSLTQYRQEASELCQNIEQSTKNELCAVITQEAEAYIENKATALGITLSAAVTLDQNFTPVSVILTGKASPYWKDRLTNEIEAELGIPKAQQTWTS